MSFGRSAQLQALGFTVQMFFSKNIQRHQKTTKKPKLIPNALQQHFCIFSNLKGTGTKDKEYVNNINRIAK
ncbi:MAG TPA: hypothetical protein VNX01_05775 [Bacteroidia bacterium]|jgi:hypothetical protein|nr:hypothetical protein [Bacteroidia bacterium]